VLAIGPLLLAACSSGGKTSQARPTTTGTEPVAVQSGFRGKERFCAEAPLTGAIEYDGTSGTVRITVNVGGLPPASDISLDWQNDTVRGYTIAAFGTDRSSHSIQASLRIFRPGEVRGYQLLLTTADRATTPLGRLAPCP
jgi:hypothetical protein